MKVVTLMFDTLRRDVLPQYGCELDMPNFKRLQEKSVTFDNFYAGSLPCMPARREMLTGQPNFLHRSWSPVEPFDTCFTDILRESGVHSHLITDHQHYWEDGGATYHNRYNTYEFVRGQEGDQYKAEVGFKDFSAIEEKLLPYNHEVSRNIRVQDTINRKYMQKEEDYPQNICMQLGVEFLEQNNAQDDWYLQIECFDPHEPFYVPDRFKDMIDPTLKDEPFDWPYGRSTRALDNPADVGIGYKNYQALLLMMDENLGKLLDAFDKYNLWNDTYLLINTDHGYLFGEKEWSGKSCMPVYEELAHTPFVMHIPNSDKNGTRSDAICQTYDIADTMYDIFKIENKPNTYGRSLLEALENDSREFGITGYYGGHVNIFDKKYTYMRGSKTPQNEPRKEYTLMPMRMRRLFDQDELTNARMVPGFSFFKNWNVIEIDNGEMFYSPFIAGNLLFDRINDPSQLTPIVDDELEGYYVKHLKVIMDELGAPNSQYERLNLEGEFNGEEERLLRQSQLVEINQGIADKIICAELQELIINLYLVNRKQVIIEAVDNGCTTFSEIKKYLLATYCNDQQVLAYV